MTEPQKISVQEIDGRMNALASQRNDALNDNALLAGKFVELQHQFAELQKQFVAQSKELGVLKAENKPYAEVG